jgi:putative aldouronate transport system permease protein
MACPREKVKRGMEKQNRKPQIGKGPAKIKKWLPLFLMMLPGAAYLIINNYIPMAGLIIAFKRLNFSKGILASDWVGLKNFEFLFSTRDAFIITRNTLLYNAAFIILNMVLGILFALFICDITSKTMKKIYQSAVLLPFLMSMVILGYIVFAFFSMQNGIVNKTLLPLLGKEPVFWYNEAKYWPAILTFVNTWKTVGYSCLIYIAAISGIDPAFYEAAELDGAGKAAQIRHITLPCILPAVITLTLLGVSKIFYSDFGLFYQVPRNSGMLFSTTNVIDTYVYRGLMNLGNLGMSSAAGFYQSLVGLTLVLLVNGIARKASRENALF